MDAQVDIYISSTDVVYFSSYSVCTVDRTFLHITWLYHSNGGY